ncbi:DUF2797 domain-containing protein [Streptomyces sp. CA-111067]|uniref:DUF2797 domain-containing protein n=1 Tax=Streptomyces sp. CA-111067 TaxID=3240046 RepID=UPI003D99D4F6
MWRCTGLRWRDGRPQWTWWLPQGPPGRPPVTGTARTSPLRLGEALSLAVAEEAVRRCAGVWRGGRWNPCPRTAALPAASRRDQCEECAVLDRRFSVAADTRDDPRPYAVYLAGFGPGRYKVGITGVARGDARLLEQAALCFTFLGEGPLMTARRTEALLGAALAIPDRMPSAAKRAARGQLPPPAERAAGLREVYDRVLALRDRLPGSLRLREYEVVDHGALFGLDPAPPLPAAEVTALPPGRALTGTVLAVAGHDLYVDTTAGCLLLDTRLAAGWPLRRPAGAVCDVPTRPVPPPVEEPQPLF